MKMGKKSIFHLCETYILTRLDITMLHTIFFFEVLKISGFGSKPKGVSVRFYKKYLFMTKMDRQSVFPPRVAHILSWLYILVLYTNFRGLEKYRFSAQNAKGFGFGFTNKCLFTVKTDQKSIFHLCETHILSQIDNT
jgi:hypothetical protein